MAFRMVGVASSAVVLALCGGACNEGTTGPIAPTPFELSVEPRRQWSGGEVQLRAALFDSISLVPRLPDSTGIPQWENLLVRLGDDTLAARRLDDTTLVVELSAVLSGTYEIEATVGVRGDRAASVTVEVYGRRGQSYAADIDWRWTRILEAAAWQPGRLLSYDNTRGAVVFVELRDGNARPIPGLSLQSRANGGPGPSYRAGHAVLDLGDTIAPPRSWEIEPVIAPRQHLACADPAVRPPGAFYAAAELPDQHCLGLHQVIGTTVTRVYDQDDTDLLPPHAAWSRATFRMAPGGTYTVILAARSRSGCACVLPGWPVLDQAGHVAYTLADYAQVPAAAFSADGDTLYVVGDLNFSPQWGEAPESYGPWVLDLRLASTGTQIHRQELTDVRFVNAILVDPVFPRLYVSAILADWKGALLILDRTSLAEVGRIQFPRADYDGILVSGGSAGSLFLALGNAGWDSGISINQFDLMP